MVYKLNLGYNVLEATKDICCAKDGGAVDHGKVTRCWRYQLITVKYPDICGISGMMVVVFGNGQGDMSSNPGLGWLHFP